MPAPAVLPPVDWAAKWIRTALLALPLYGALLFSGTLTHQPDYKTQFRDYAEYITTNRFIVDHLVVSIFGTAVAMIGVLALAAALVRSAGGRAAVWGAVLSVSGLVFIQAVIGAAAFAQPAIGNAYLAGQRAAAVSINDGVYGPRTIAVALVGIVLYMLGGGLLARAVWRSQSLPRWAGVLYGVSVPLISLFGLAFGFAQTIGSLLLIAAGGWIAAARWRAPALDPLVEKTP
jgi:hypothetical protein